MGKSKFGRAAKVPVVDFIWRVVDEMMKEEEMVYLVKSDVLEYMLRLLEQSHVSCPC